MASGVTVAANGRSSAWPTVEPFRLVAPPPSPAAGRSSTTPTQSTPCSAMTRRASSASASAATTGPSTSSASPTVSRPRRLRPRSWPRNPATKSLAGARSSSSGGPTCSSTPPTFEDGDPVAQLDGLVDVVGDEHDRLLDLATAGPGARPGAGPARWGPPPSRARPSAGWAGRRPGPGPPRLAAAGRRTGPPGSASGAPGRGRPARSARPPAGGSGPCPSPAAWARWRCSRRWSCAGRGRSAG